MAFDIDPAAGALLPTAGDPFGARPRANDIMAFDPDMLVAVPPPVAGLPALDFDPFGRKHGDDFDARRWRSRRYVDFGLKLREGRGCDGHGTGYDRETTEQAAAREMVHRLLRTGIPE
jgi:hypothetical protein